MAIEGFSGDAGEPTYTGPVEDEDAGPYRTEVVVQRLGGGTFPVDVLMVFEGGRRILEPWDGKARWKTFVVEGPAKIAYAVVDPERTLLLDRNPTNNSRLAEPASPLAAAKWGSKWMIWLQDLLLVFAFFS